MDITAQFWPSKKSDMLLCLICKGCLLAVALHQNALSARIVTGKPALHQSELSATVVKGKLALHRNAHSARVVKGKHTAAIQHTALQWGNWQRENIHHAWPI